MRVNTIKMSTQALATMLLLATGVLGSTASTAASVSRQVNLPGIAPAGYASFSFNSNSFDGGYTETIQNWYNNLFYLSRSRNGVTYDLIASQQGGFRYWESPGQSYQGVMGEFLLTARLGPAGRLLKGEMKITGRIKGLGILNPDRVLAKADVTQIVTRNSLIGFAIENITCAKEIIHCQDNSMIAESVYLRLRQQFPDIRALGDGVFVTGIRANLTTVPIPATAWLMLSGIGMLGARAARRKRRTAD